MLNLWKVSVCDMYDIHIEQSFLDIIFIGQVSRFHQFNLTAGIYLATSACAIYVDY